MTLADWVKIDEKIQAATAPLKAGSHENVAWLRSRLNDLEDKYGSLRRRVSDLETELEVIKRRA